MTTTTKQENSELKLLMILDSFNNKINISERFRDTLLLLNGIYLVGMMIMPDIFFVFILMMLIFFNGFRLWKTTKKIKKLYKAKQKLYEIL